MHFPSGEHLIGAAISMPSRVAGIAMLAFDVGWKWATKLFEHIMLQWVADHMGDVPVLRWAIEHPFQLFVTLGVSYILVIVFVARRKSKKQASNEGGRAPAPPIGESTGRDRISTRGDNSPAMNAPGGTNYSAPGGIINVHQQPTSAIHETNVKETPYHGIEPFYLTIHDCFTRDFSKGLMFGQTWQIGEPHDIPGSYIEFVLIVDLPTRSRYLKWYISLSRDTYALCGFISENYTEALKAPETMVGAGTISGPVPPGEPKGPSVDEAIFTGAMYIYHEGPIPEDKLTLLRSLYASKNLKVSFHGPVYLESKKTELLDQDPRHKRVSIKRRSV